MNMMLAIVLARGAEFLTRKLVAGCAEDCDAVCPSPPLGWRLESERCGVNKQEADHESAAGDEAPECTVRVARSARGFDGIFDGPEARHPHAVEGSTGEAAHRRRGKHA